MELKVRDKMIIARCSTAAVVFALLILVFWSCDNRGTSQEIDFAQEEIAFKEFNKKAADHFVRSYDKDKMQPITDSDWCVFQKVVKDKLDEMNNSRTVVIDSFYVRSYYSDDLLRSFSFISNRRGQMYLVSFPKFDEYLATDKYYELDKQIGQTKLKDSLSFSLVKINSDLFDEFFRAEVQSIDDLKKQYKMAEKLMPELAPFLNNPIQTDELLEDLKNRPKKNLEYIYKTINPIINRERVLADDPNRYDIYKYEPLGIFLLSYYVDPSEAEDCLKLDIFFIPQQYSYFIRRESIAREFPECF